MARRRDAEGNSACSSLKSVLLILSIAGLIIWQNCSANHWRNQLPQPILPDYKSIEELYWKTWEILSTNIQHGNSANGFVREYINAEEDIFIVQGPTIQTALFGSYGADVFPVMESLDNFYRGQRKDGFIARIYNSLTGEYLHIPSVTEPMIHPPLFTWSELHYYYLTGDRHRLRRWRPVLEQYFQWLDNFCKGDGEARGLYYTSLTGTRMINSPRKPNELGGWVDMSAQMALFARDLAQIAEIFGDSAAVRNYRQKYEQIAAAVRNRLWHADDAFYYDLNPQGQMLKLKVISGFWPLLAQIPTPEEAAQLIEHLRDSREFYRQHLFPSLAAAEQDYNRQGAYWRGGVWGDQCYMVIKGLKQYGEYDFANQAAWNHIINLERVYRQFQADTTLVEIRDRAKVAHTIWEVYAPEKEEPATRWDAKFYGRPAYVASSGFGPVAMLIEDVLGFEANAPQDELTWRPWLLNQHGIRNFKFGKNLVTIWCEKRESTDAPLKIHGTTSSPFKLNVWLNGKSKTINLKRGRIRLELNPADLQ